LHATYTSNEWKMLIPQIKIFLASMSSLLLN
jgi:hypothetical protein